MKVGDLVREKSQWMLVDKITRRAREQIGVVVRVDKRRATELSGGYGELQVQYHIKWLRPRRDGRRWFAISELGAIV